VRQAWLILAIAAGLLALALGVAVLRTDRAAPPRAGRPAAAVAAPSPGPSAPTQIALWPGGAPDMSGDPQPPERVKVIHAPEALLGDTSAAIFNVTSPTLTIFPPKGRNSGVAMIVLPGGGFSALAITLEGTEICHWVIERGMTCALLKYRVPKSDHYWDEACRCHVTPKVPTALQDTERAVRLVRARAASLDVDPGRIGVIGFSAGGYLAAQVSNLAGSLYRPVDAADRSSSRPDFAVALYPGHLCRPGGALDPGLHVTRQAPPTFLLQAWDDPVDDICNSLVYARALDAAGVSTEVHLFAKGGHAFGLRRTAHPVAMWPTLVEKWLKEIGMLSQ
jgi:acetyl esterase/lipase